VQTADIVILFDSDWNPQADLQAQDRAHRIGQKKQVQCACTASRPALQRLSNGSPPLSLSLSLARAQVCVYRLVTDNSIEEKVIERAQQKLKLDAMVVQQGRIADASKSLSKDEMSEMIRFGADKVFKSSDTDITEEDIDLILERGEERTKELNANLDKMTDHDKGDLYNFSLDGAAIKTQTFDGVDYSDRAERDKEREKEELARILREASLADANNMGTRVRKQVCVLRPGAGRCPCLSQAGGLPRAAPRMLPRGRLPILFACSLVGSARHEWAACSGARVFLQRPLCARSASLCC
jgi:SWI/SNF-related matrix-associated actin-dependent regulator of chromatin subfamily A member 5